MSRREMNWYYRTQIKKGNTTPSPDPEMVLSAVDALGVDLIGFISKSPWGRVGLTDGLVLETHFAYSVPSLRQFFITWAGLGDEALVHYFFHEAFEVLSYSEGGKRPLVTDCNHEKCIMNENSSSLGLELNTKHIRGLDRYADGNVTVDDLDLNRDGFLRIGFVMVPEKYGSADLRTKLARALKKLLPQLESSKIKVEIFDYDRVVAEAGTSWKMAV